MQVMSGIALVDIQIFVHLHGQAPVSFDADPNGQLGGSTLLTDGLQADDFARTMLADGIDISTVQKITRLSAEDIQGLSH